MILNLIWDFKKRNFATNSLDQVLVNHSIELVIL